MLFEFEVKVIEADSRIRCNKCGKGFNVGTTIVTRGHGLVEDKAYSEKHRIYSGGEGSRIYLHKKCSTK